MKVHDFIKTLYKVLSDNNLDSTEVDIEIAFEAGDWSACVGDMYISLDNEKTIVIEC